VKFFVVIGLAAWSWTARADVPKGIAQRVAQFALDGCDFFKKNPPQPHKETPDKNFAMHFGRITRSERDGVRIRYDLKISAFDGWEVSYWARGVDMKVPSPMAITMGDLQQLLGRDDGVDVDKAMASTSAEAQSELEERVFQPHGHGVCRVFVQTEANGKKGAERRVFSLRFAD
jgi:hypothetical protein